uniref:Uncharacterized protein n=1 Tax=Sphaerodactylus townsendi TaxID=933632 RepID=A0ACB8F0D6_9SAUR
MQQELHFLWQHGTPLGCAKVERKEHWAPPLLGEVPQAIQLAVQCQLTNQPDGLLPKAPQGLPEPRPPPPGSCTLERRLKDGPAALLPELQGVGAKWNRLWLYKAGHPVRFFPRFMLVLWQQFENHFQEKGHVSHHQRIRQGTRSGLTMSEFQQLAEVIQDWLEQ